MQNAYRWPYQSRAGDSHPRGGTCFGFWRGADDPFINKIPELELKTMQEYYPSMPWNQYEITPEVRHAVDRVERAVGVLRRAQSIGNLDGIIRVYETFGWINQDPYNFDRHDELNKTLFVREQT